MAQKYDEQSIQTLDALHHIRLRSGMYIGRLGDGSNPDDGIYVLLKEVIDNSVDEYIMGYGRKIEIALDANLGEVSVRDFGRGIPLGKLRDCVSQINTGAKYNDAVFQFSVGLNGVGLKAVNALSEHFYVKTVRDKSFKAAYFCKGLLQKEETGKTDEANGTFVRFTPDSEIFGSFQFSSEFIVRRVQYYAYLNAGLKLIFNGQEVVSEGGLLDLLQSEITDETLYPPLHIRAGGCEFALLHTAHYGESIFSFVNGQHTSDGGTHVQAFRDGLCRALNEFSKKTLQSVDIREGLVAALLVKVKDPVFESQTKNKLGNTELRSTLAAQVKDLVLDLLHKNSTIAEIIVDRVLFNEKLRKELQSVRKEAKEKHKKIALKIPKLRDCRYHLHEDSPQGEETMIFLTEGDSASASVVASRNPLTQAVFSLRGKPLNVHGMKLDQLYKNEELFHLMSALNIESGIEHLRYNKVILATDADVDGFHIRNLLITFFLTYFEGLVHNNHLYILETPLFKIRRREQTIYCYSEKERDMQLAKLPKDGVEITRFKGLGEISPGEFKQFIAKDMRIIPVCIHQLSEIRPMLEFYMGKNTPERKDFIMNNLIREGV
jgi:topoisomerase IV subunit B